MLEAWTYQLSLEDSAWELLDDDMKLVMLEPTRLVFSQRNREQLLVIAHDSDFEFAQQEPFFVVLMTPTAAIGLRFASAEDEEQLLRHCDKLKNITPFEIQEVEKAEQATVEDEAAPFLHCMNLVRTKKDVTWTRGAKVKAMAICTRHRFMHVFKPLLILTLEQFFVSNDPKTIIALYNAINAMDLTKVPVFSLAERRIRRGGLEFPDSIYATHCMLDTIKVPVRIPLTMLDEEVGQPSIVPLITKFGEGVMTILNSLLFERRIIFLGYAHPAGEVCDMVLAALAMVSPPLHTVIKRTFPYTNLVNLDFLQLPSYLAGTTNLLFQQREEWWDVLCDIETGTVTLSAKILAEQKESPDTWLQADAGLFGDIRYALDQHYGHNKIMDMIQGHVMSIVNMARGVEEFKDEAARMYALDVNRKRIEKLKRTSQFKDHLQLVEERRLASPVQGTDVEQDVRKLLALSLSDEEMLRLFQQFIASVVSDDQITYFLQHFPDVYGGLLPIGVALFHESESVRSLVVELFSRIEKNRYGKLLVAKLNRFILLAYRRNQYLVGTL